MRANDKISANLADYSVSAQVPAALDPAFQDDYYHKLLPGLRTGMLVLVLVHLLHALYFRATHGFFSNAFQPEAGGGSVIFLLTFSTGFCACRQPVIFVLFSGIITFLLLTAQAPLSTTAADTAANRLQGLMRPGIPVIVYGFVLTRIQFRWLIPSAALLFVLGPEGGGNGLQVIASSDQGMGGKGITEAQARQLFVPFGRLDTHAAVEGTGLGLLSVRGIVETHGGEVFIEGTVDSFPASAGFTTASRAKYPSMLTEPCRTAFVLTCPTTRRLQQGTSLSRLRRISLGACPMRPPMSLASLRISSLLAATP